jgi:hypothetical protein
MNNKKERWGDETVVVCGYVQRDTPLVTSCKYCDRIDNDFVPLNDTTDYSGIGMSLNKQGMLRTRYYDDSSHIWFAEDIVNINFCPMCGRKLTEEE